MLYIDCERVYTVEYSMDSQEHLNRLWCQRVVTESFCEVQQKSKGVDEHQKNNDTQNIGSYIFVVSYMSLLFYYRT